MPLRHGVVGMKCWASIGGGESGVGGIDASGLCRNVAVGAVGCDVAADPSKAAALCYTQSAEARGRLNDIFRKIVAACPACLLSYI